LTAGLNVAIRVDASTQIGSGHLMRCLALADELRSRNATVRFISRHLPDSLAALVAARGHALSRLRPACADEADAFDLAHSAWLGSSQAQDAEDTLAALSGIASWDWVIVDHYALDARWESAVRRRATQLLAIDDLADRPHAADALVDQNLQPPTGDRYAGLVSARCTRLVGPRFALLRPEFRNRTTRADPEVSSRVLVNIGFGGVDPAGMTTRALAALSALPRDRFAIDAVVGSANPHLPTIAAQCAAVPNSRLYVDASDVAELLRAADIAIGAGGIMALERCAVGLPQVLVSIAANQRPGCKALASAHVAIDLGPMTDVRDDALADVVARLADRPRLLARVRQRAAALVDGRGAERVSMWMTRSELSLRPAERADVAQAWRWRNHPSTRRFMFDPAVIPWPTHCRWWELAIADPARSLLVLQSGATGVGVLRFDYEGDRATISIYLDPELNGIGLGSAALRAGIRWIARGMSGRKVRLLRAEILPTNESSRRSFAAAGFDPTPAGIEWIREVNHG
jgi:UDP-2,4-diacetamido-2,4,6-trideoxy-beta-L-altropyranose hydrolase